ncbi:XdhC family protein [Comamonadaceae bacterium M7527]|nr:XdhC family protein [Comamonadaceae bacterium M7527]
MNRNEWLHQAHRLQTNGESFALVTVLRAQAPTSGKAGDKAVVTVDGKIHGWIGGGCAQPAVIKTVRSALQDGQPRTIRITPSDESQERSLGDVLEFGMACHSGGTLELFIDPVIAQAELVVMGDSPVARSLVSLAPRLGLRVVAVAQDAQAHDFPEASAVVASDDTAAVRAQVSANSFVVVATQGRRDMPCLESALSTQPAQLWFVASHRKAGVLRGQLVARGQTPEQVARIVAPAGESIGAQTPEEIALSVLASVVAARRQATPLAQVLGQQVQAAQPESALAAAQTAAPAKTCCGGAASKAAVQAAAVDAGAAAQPQAAEPVQMLVQEPVQEQAHKPSDKPSCCGS